LGDPKTRSQQKRAKSGKKEQHRCKKPLGEQKRLQRDYPREEEKRDKQKRVAHTSGEWSKTTSEGTKDQSGRRIGDRGCNKKGGEKTYGEVTLGGDEFLSERGYRYR